MLSAVDGASMGAAATSISPMPGWNGSVAAMDEPLATPSLPISQPTIDGTLLAPLADRVS
jgi:hypothetical protein